MVYEINWDLNGNLPIHYLNDIDYFINNNKIEFTKGLNILVGDNGCGKSTMINIIKYYFLEQHDNVPVLNTEEFDHLSLMPINDGFHDGINVVASYGTPTISMNNPMDMASSSRMDMNNILFHLEKGSQGEVAMMAYNQCVDILYSHNSRYSHPYKIIENVLANYDGLAKIKEYYDNNDKKDRITCMVMDEPDNSVSILNIVKFQKELDSLVKNCSDGMQVIMVLHNPILLMHFIDNPKVNIIEMTDGYIDTIKELKNNI